MIVPKTLVHATLAVALLAVPGAACASSPEAWNQLQRNVFRACAAQSGLKSARVTAYWPDFEAYAVAQVRGIAASRTRAERAQALCLYNKRTGTAETSHEQPLR